MLKAKERQRLAVQSLQRTLDGIDWDKFWERVIKRVTPRVEANERIRAKSLEHGWKSVR